MARDRDLIYAYIGTGDQRQLRLEALKRLAGEAGFEYDGAPSISQWLQYLADEKIRADQMGYYAVLVDDDEEQRLIFLDQRPYRDIGDQLLLRDETGAMRTWENGLYLGLVGEVGAIDLLGEYGIQLAEGEKVQRNKAYVVWKGKKAPYQGEPVVRTCIKELLTEKRERDQRKWITAEISRATGLNRAILRRYALDEIKRFRVTTLDTLCEFFDCQVGDLLYIDGMEEES